MSEIGFKNFMFVFSLEDASNPEDLMVTIPDAFIDKISTSGDSTKILKGDMTVFKNTNIPAFSKYYISRNYLKLPVIKYFGGSSNIVGPAIFPRNNTLVVENNKPTNYPMDVGIGNVKVGERLLAVFMNNNPNLGFIIARC